MASFIERLFGGVTPPERREAVLAYLAEEWKLQALQDTEGGLYNDVLTKYGGGATAGSEGMSEIVSAAKRQAEAYASLSGRHTALGPVPDEAGECYLRWEHTYLALAEWASATAAAYEGFNAGATPHAGRLQELLSAEEKAERNARKEEVKLLKRIEASVEDVRRLMQESGDTPSGEPPAESEEMSALDLIPLKELESSVATTSLLATEPINKAWGGLTGENPISAKSNFSVRLEMLWFFLHVVNRFAFGIGGPGARATIQDAIATTVMTDAITSSFDISQANKGFDAEKWQRNMITDVIEGLNEAEAAYGSCKEVYGESSGVGAWLSDDSVVGRLAGRIAETAGQSDNVDLKLLIAKTAVEALSKSGLTDRVAKACEVVAAK